MGNRIARNGLVALGSFIVGLTAVAASATTWTVNASGTTFSPANITVAPGDTVHWVWINGIHTTTSGTSCTHNTPYFNAPLDSTHTTFNWVVPTGVGLVPYYCQVHCAMGMTGLITVQSGVTQSFMMTLDGNQENPPISTTATGTGTATLDLVTNLLTWSISYSGLTPTLAHFHGPALACVNAGIQITLNPATNPITGSASLTAAQAADLLAGRWYVNLHTVAHSGGEIRGQVMPTPLADPIPTAIPQGDLYVHLTTVASGLTAPNWGTTAPGDSARLFVVDQNGTLWAIDRTTGAKSVFLDVSARLVALGVFGPDSYDERGFLGVAFHPSYATNGLLYTFTSEPVSGPADFTTLPNGATPDCQSVIAEWHVPTPADPNSVVDPGSRRELIRIDKPQFNHNGGAMAFGPDGYLYISTGDGGGADDRDGQNFITGPIVGHGCDGNGQNINVILGKLIRIDPLGNNSANGKYGIPASNPFVGLAGLDEIWAYGFRNPWRFTFDSTTGQLYCGDVGQNNVEEVDIVTSGGNYGWRAKEGSFYFVFNGDLDGYVTDVPLDVPVGLVDPIANYDHDEGIATIGGYVYRGTKLPALTGKYVFGDLARTFNNDARLFYLDTGNQIKEFRLIGQSAVNLFLDGFGQDSAGEIYALGNTTGTPFGTTGVVLRIGPLVGDMNCDGVVDFGDINPFVLYLSNFTAWQSAFPGCPATDGDINGDGVYGQGSFGDINPFVALLSGG